MITDLLYFSYLNFTKPGYYKFVENEILVKINLNPEKKVKKMVNVCAWCPKEQYPNLEIDEEYTHGLCENHYQLLKSKKRLM